jgi:hypothetical protein
MLQCTIKISMDLDLTPRRAVRAVIHRATLGEAQHLAKHWTWQSTGEKSGLPRHVMHERPRFDANCRFQPEEKSMAARNNALDVAIAFTKAWTGHDIGDRDLGNKCRGKFWH